MNNDLISRLLPVLGRSLDIGFNVFDVMHHGTHEKQLSNVFRWFLEIGGTHNFEDLGQRLFIEQVYQNGDLEHELPAGPFTVRQEVNTSEPGEPEDIADLVLESDTTVIIVENYETSDGHGHSYESYLRFGQRGGKNSIVVLLCLEENTLLQTHGWEQAQVVTYERFLNRLMEKLDRYPKYALRNPEQYGFISQMHSKYASGEGRMNDKEVLDFITAMCATGEARRYQERPNDVAAERFSSDVAQQARERFSEGGETLRRLKAIIRSYANQVLRQQLNNSLAPGMIEKVTASYRGIYQWTVNLEFGPLHESANSAHVQIKFGPSAWFANEDDTSWEHKVNPQVADYSRLFITNPLTRVVRQSSVSLHEILDGLSPDDKRLHDEIISLLRAS